MDDLCAALVPSTGARRAVVGSFAVAALGTGGVMAFGLPGGLDQRCADPEARLAGVWDDDARRGGAEAFEHTGLSYADELWDKLSHKLDAYADAWTDGYRDACEATHKRGEASVHTLDLRMSCLGQARAELGVVSEALAHADGNVLSETDRLVAGLPSLERCADVDALQAGTPPPSPEVRDEVEALQARVAEARANRELGRIDEAEALLDGIPARAKITGYDPLIARLDFELGRLALNRAHLVDSEAAFKRVLERAQKLGDSQLAGAAALELLRASSDDTYDPGRGEAYSRIARAIVSGMPGQERLEARRLAYDASRRAAVGDDPGALRLFEEALANLAKVEGDHVRIEMSIRNGYAMLLGRNARLEEAETEERRVLDALLATLGERHPAVGSAHANLGQTLTRLGEHEEAEEHARLALEIKRDAYGDMHPAVARAYRNLAEILGDKDALAEAIEISRQVVETQIRANGRNHPSVAEARSSLGIILRKAGQYEAAVSELEQALAIQLEAFGPDTVEVAKSRGNLANTWFIWHRYEDAEREGRLAVRLFTELQGPDHAHTRTARANLASYLRSAGKYEEAEALLREAIDGNARAMGPKSMAVGDLRLNLANLLLATGRAREAVVEHEAAVRITVAAYGADHPATAAARYSYALSLNEVGRRADAEKELQIALEIRQRAFPSGHVVIADTARMLGQILFDAGRTDEAEPLLRQAYEITRPTETPSDERGGAAFAYARLLWRRYPARRDEARTLARGALDDLTTARNNGQDVDDQPVRTWVAAHP
jgi:tetratricopeptide (TPR) repeat protein